MGLFENRDGSQILQSACREPSDLVTVECISGAVEELLFQKLRDFGFELLHKRIKLGNFDRVVPLFMLSKSSEIRNVLRTPAMEKLHVLFDDFLSNRGRLTRGNRFPLFLLLQSGRQSGVACFPKVQPIFREVRRGR